MRKGKLTREQAIEQVGLKAVAELDYENAEPTNRVGHNGACQGDAFTEWSASLNFTDSGGCERSLTAYYYTSTEQDQIMSNHDGDGSCISWEIDGYEVW